MQTSELERIGYCFAKPQTSAHNTSDWTKYTVVPNDGICESNKSGKHLTTHPPLYQQKG